ncbi:Rossmann-like domain-containing protein [Bacteroidota bacterium]
MQEPLLTLYNIYGFDHNSIQNIVCGEKYHAVILKNGNIGVCSTLNKIFKLSLIDLKNPDLDNIKHRIILNAYYNAQLNYLNTYNEDCDIFKKIKFKDFSNIVMTGYFGPLVRKFRKEKIKLNIFDKKTDHRKVLNIENQVEYISEADALILSATTIFNNSFCELVEATNKNCKIFLLGPSSIMCKEILSYKNMSIIFGSIFSNNDQKILKEISQGGGTKSFSPFSRKVYFTKNQG